MSIQVYNTAFIVSTERVERVLQRVKCHSRLHRVRTLCVPCLEDWMATCQSLHTWPPVESDLERCGKAFRRSESLTRSDDRLRDLDTLAEAALAFVRPASAAFQPISIANTGVEGSGYRRKAIVFCLEDSICVLRFYGHAILLSVLPTGFRTPNFSSTQY